MKNLVIVVMLCLVIAVTNGLRFMNTRMKYQYKRISRGNCNKFTLSSRLMLDPVSHDDMEQLSFILANVSSHLIKEPEVSFLLAVEKMEWLYSKNVPRWCVMCSLNRFRRPLSS